MKRRTCDASTRATKPATWTGWPPSYTAARELAPRCRLGQRERERERDASATLTRPITPVCEAHRLSSTLFPKESTLKTPLSKNDPVPLPRALLKPVSVRPQSPTQTRPMYIPRQLATGLVGVYTRWTNSCQPLTCLQDSLTAREAHPYVCIDPRFLQGRLCSCNWISGTKQGSRIGLRSDVAQLPHTGVYALGQHPLERPAMTLEALLRVWSGQIA